MIRSDARVVVLGAGPTGLGAANRLVELGHPSFDLYEGTDAVGGLARSVVDEAGFVWDMGGHVQFSHYEYFDRLMDELLGDAWLTHERVASVMVAGRLVPYPIQLHLDALPPELEARCRQGLERAGADAHEPPAHFRAWLLATFGDELAELFMLPYNFKVWAYPPEQMAFQWVGERVAQPSPAPSRNGWGPNRTFRFPERGGTGEIWRRLAARLPSERVHLDKRLVAVDTRRRRIRFADGTTTDYDALISTIPLDELVRHADLPHLQRASSELMHSSVHVVGVGLRGRPAPHVADQSWMYFAGDDCPFYRATVFSNYSPHHVPDPVRMWSLMVEVSESPCKAVDADRVVSEVVDGLVATGLVEHPEQVLSTWHQRLEHGYPTPSLGRDAALEKLLPALEEHAILSRGRFGAWKYEVSNQDHSLMQGVEAVDHLLRDVEEVTVFDPARVNRGGRRPAPARPAPPPPDGRPSTAGGAA